METNDTNDPLAQPVELPEDEDGQTTAPHKLKSPKKSRKFLKILLLLVVLAGIGFAVWKFLLSDNGSSSNNNQQEQSFQTENAEQGNDDVPPVGGLKTYDNGFLRVTLQHPDTWTVTEKDNGVRLESPLFTYDTMTGKAEGNFRIYIRKGAREQDSKYIGQAVVIQPTEKLKYENPTAAQRKETNLSFFGYGDTSNFAFFMITGNFVLDKGDTLGPNYAKETDAYIIAGGYSEPALEDDLNFNKVSTEGFDQTKAYEQGLNIIKSLELR